MTYSWFHKNGSFNVNTFNENLTNNTQVAEGTVFRKHSI